MKMIIFDLDCLADDSHRRHFIDPEDNDDECYSSYCDCPRWKPDYAAYNDACEGDEVIRPVLDTFIHLTQGEPFNYDIEIWSGRCESVREKTLNWLVNMTGYTEDYRYWERRLKMRPIGDNTPEWELKEKWLNEKCKHVSLNLETRKTIKDNHEIEFVFDKDAESISMFRRNGIFVFSCNQESI